MDKHLSRESKRLYNIRLYASVVLVGGVVLLGLYFVADYVTAVIRYLMLLALVLFACFMFGATIIAEIRSRMGYNPKTEETSGGSLLESVEDMLTIGERLDSIDKRISRIEKRIDG